MSSKWKILKDDGPPSDSKDNPYGYIWDYYVAEFFDGLVYPVTYYFPTKTWRYVTSGSLASPGNIIAWRRLPTREEESE